MATARNGDRVRIHYTGRLTDGRVFCSTERADGDERLFGGIGVEYQPEELVVGAGALPPACEDALVGLEPGQAVRVTVPAADAFGPRREELVVTLPRAEVQPLHTHRAEGDALVPVRFEPKVGETLQVTTATGAVVEVRVVALTDDTITLDRNHPLAGHDLVFELRLVEMAGRAGEVTRSA